VATLRQRETEIRAYAQSLHDDERKSAEKRAAACRRNSATVSGVENLVTPLLTAGAELFRGADHLINTISGIVDLRNGELMPHDRTEYFTHVITTEYEPSAQSDLWDRLLTEWMGDQEIIEYAQTAIGYTLSGSTREECLFYLQGTPDGRDGKGTFLNTIARILGKPLAQSIGMDVFTGSARNDPQGFRLAPLYNTRLVVASETEPGRRMNEEAVKRLTGRDDIACAFKCKTQFSYEPRFAIWLMSNHETRANPDDGAYWRRIKIIPFPNSVPFEELDKTLKDRLLTEDNRRAVLAWCIAGAQRWYATQQGLQDPPAIADENKKQRSANDGVGRWIDESCVLLEGGPDEPVAWTNRDELWDSYKKWADDNNEFMLSSRKWAQYLNANGYKVEPKKFAGMDKTIRKVYGLGVSW